MSGSKSKPMVAQRDDEVFDVVDAHDVPMGRATRREVHTQGLRHRAVHVLVFNAAGQVFLQKRSMAKDIAPGLWESSVSGHLDTGEDYDACAVRELREELGLTLPSGVAPVRILRLDACWETGQEFVWIYRCEAEGPFTYHPAEVDGGAWYDPKELAGLMAAKPADFTRPLCYYWPRLIL